MESFTYYAPAYTFQPWKHKHIPLETNKQVGTISKWKPWGFETNVLINTTEKTHFRLWRWKNVYWMIDWSLKCIFYQSFSSVLHLRYTRFINISFTITLRQKPRGVTRSRCKTGFLCRITRQRARRHLVSYLLF